MTSRGSDQTTNQRRRGTAANRWVPSAWTGLVLVAVSAAWSSAADSSAELAEFLVEKNEAARRAIASASYEISYTYRSGGDGEGPRHSVGRAKMLHKGDWRVADVSSVQQFRDKSEKTYARRAVLNDDYAATWHVGTGTAHQRDHESIGSRTKDAKMWLESNFWPHPMRYGFGGVHDTLAERWRDADQHGEDWRITLKPPDHDDAANELYYIEVYRYEQRQDVPSHTYVIDPAKGYLVTRTFSYGADGRIGYVTDVEAGFDEAGGVWFPSRIIERSHPGWPMQGWAALDEAFENVPPELSIEMKHFRANQPLADDLFTLDALGLEGRVFLIRRRLDDEREIHVHRDGQILPQRVEGAIRRGERRLEVITDEMLQPVEETQGAAAEASASGREPSPRPEASSDPPAAAAHGWPARLGWLIALGGLACLAVLAVITGGRNIDWS